MATRGLYVVKHCGELGNAQACALFDKLVVANCNPATPARGFGAYAVSFDGRRLAAGEELIAALGVAALRRC